MRSFSCWLESVVCATGLYSLLLLFLLTFPGADNFLSVTWFADVLIGVYLATRRERDRFWPLVLPMLGLVHFAITDDLATAGFHTTSFAIPHLVAIAITAHLAAGLLRQPEARAELLVQPSTYATALALVSLVPAIIGSSLLFIMMFSVSERPFPEAWLTYTVPAILGSLAAAPVALHLAISGPAETFRSLLETRALVASSGMALAITASIFTAQQDSLIYFTVMLLAAALLSNVAQVAVSFMLAALILSANIGQLAESSGKPTWQAMLGSTPNLLILLFPLLLAVAVDGRKRLTQKLEATLKRNHTLYQNSSAAIHAVDRTGRLISVSDTWLTLLGYERTDVIGRRFTDFVVSGYEALPHGSSANDELNPQASSSGNAVCELIRRNGDHLSVTVSIISDTGQSKEDDGVLAVIQDISRETRLAQQLSADKEMLEVTLRSIADGVVVTDDQMNITFINPAAAKLIGIPPLKALKKPFDSIVRIFSEEDGQRLDSPVRACLRDRKRHSIPADACLQTESGEMVSIADSVAPILNDQQQLVGAVMVIQDTTETREAVERMSYLAKHDALTDLPNRVLLADRMVHACANAQRYCKKVGVIFLDMDNFKLLNDSLGHAAGDTFLKSVADVLLSTVRSSDTVCRLGGDEFVVLLENIDTPKEILCVVEKLQQRIRALDGQYDNQFDLSASMGIAVYPDDGEDHETLLRRADAAMYHAKEMGRSQHRFYSRRIEKDNEQQNQLVKMIKQITERDQLGTAIQPIIDSRTGRICSAELLCRFPEDEGAVDIEKCISLAEEKNLIYKMTLQIIERGFDLLDQWQRKLEPEFRLAINISPKALVHPDFVKDIAALMLDYDVAATRITLEITESTYLSNPDAAARTLQSLRAKGFCVALDDFGTGYSSLAYLKRYPMDILKLDKEFIVGIESDPNSVAFVELMINLAHSLNMQVVAEGVETEAHRKILTDLGCDKLQGYHFDRPLKPLEFASRLEDQLPAMPLEA